MKLNFCIQKQRHIAAVLIGWNELREPFAQYRYHQVLYIGNQLAR